MTIVITPGLDSAGFCSELNQNIKNMGPKVAFGVGDLVIPYSGPSNKVRSALKTTFTSNWVRSRDQATRLGGRRIDDTAVGKFLANFDFDTYFRAFYGSNIKAREKAEFSVWATASEQFMRAQFYQVATAVCAADPERVFRKHEIGSIIKNRRVKTINNRDAILFKDFYKINPDEAYRLFCITELLDARAYAQKENTKAAWDDYRERRCFFLLDMQLTFSPILPATKKMDITKAKRVALAKYHMAKTRGKLASAVRPALRARLPKVDHKLK